MIKVKIICQNSYCGRKTIILTRINFVEENYFCPVCGTAQTKIEEVD
jgi:rubredoxin